MKRKKSLKKKLMTYWVILVLIMIVITASYAMLFFHGYRNSVLKDVQSIAERHAESIGHDLNTLQSHINSYYTSDVEYQKMIRGGMSEYDRIAVMNHIGNSIEVQGSVLDFTGGYFYYNAEYDVLWSAYSGLVDSSAAKRLDRVLKHLVKEKSDITSYSGELEYNSNSYLVRWIGAPGHPAGYLFCISDYLEYEEDVEAAFLDQDLRVLEHVGDLTVDDADIVSLAEGDKRGFSQRSSVAAAAQIPESAGLTLVVIRQYPFLLTMQKRPETWLIFVLLPFVSLIFLLFFYRMLKESLYVPVGHVLSRIQEMRNGENGISPEEETEIIEYSRINEQIDGMLNEITELQEEKAREQFRANEAQLQYYQLQTNPHFYLNCMNTVSTLIENGNVDMANDLIKALSSHFRYMFRSNRTSVTVEEELKEAREYCEIYSIKSGFPILFMPEMDEESAKARLPLLSIQTFVGNAVKHFQKTDQVLMIKVQIRILNGDDGERKLNIRISDNGSGYSEEKLRELNEPVREMAYKSMNVGIDNLKYRLMLRYNDKAQLYFYNSPFGGAVAEMTIPEVLDEPSST